MLETDPREASGQLIIVKRKIEIIIEIIEKKEQNSRSNLNY